MPAIVKTLITAVTLLGSYRVATADPIVIVRDGRRVSASGSIQGAVQFDNPFAIKPGVPDSITRERVQGDVLSVTARPTVDEGQVFSDAFLISNISDPGHMSGFGATQTSLSLNGSGPGDQFSFLVLNARGESDVTFAVDFRLESPFDFVFASPRLFGDVARASLSGAGSVFFDVGAVESESTFRQAGHLNPGDYALLVEETSILVFGSRTLGQGGLRFTFDLTPTGPAPTPEPASLLLLGTGIAGALAVRRRSTNPMA
jgi:PEP-CTERM motif